MEGKEGDKSVVEGAAILGRVEGREEAAAKEEEVVEEGAQGERRRNGERRKKGDRRKRAKRGKSREIAIGGRGRRGVGAGGEGEDELNELNVTGDKDARGGEQESKVSASRG